MTRLTALSVIVLLTTACCSAQTRWPLRSGEWEATTQGGGESTALLYCINDALWQKGLTQNPSCTISDMNLTSRGATYFMNCPLRTFQMKGKVVLSFDGMEHMTGDAMMEMTVNGKVSNATSRTDYRWKGSTCGPQDMNLRAGH